MDLVEAAVSLAVALDRLRVLNTSWMTHAGNPSEEMGTEMLDVSEAVRVAVVTLVRP